MRRAVRLILFVIVLGMMVAAAVFFVEHRRIADGTYLSDDRTIRVPAAEAPVRRVLWTPPIALGSGINTDEDEYEPYISGDGRLLLFVRGRPGGSADIYASRRSHDGWEAPRRLSISSEAHDELGPTLSPDGGTLFFASDRPGGAGGYDLWACDIDASLQCTNPRNLGDRVNSPFDELNPAVSPDGSVLVFASNREGGPVTPDAWSTTLRESVRDADYDLYAGALTARGIEQARAIDALNTEAREGAPAFSPAGDFLYFASDRSGDLDIHRVRLTPGKGVFSIGHPVEQVETPINGASQDLDPSLGQLGFALVFSSDRGSTEEAAERSADFDLYLSTAREVYRTVEAASIDWASMVSTMLAWLLWLLLVLLLVLLLMRVLRRAQLRERYRRLSLLARCLLISMLIHLLLLGAVGAWRLGSTLGNVLDRASGTRVAIMSREGTTELARQIRGRLTSISVRPSALATNVPAAVPVLASVEAVGIRAPLTPTPTPAVRIAPSIPSDARPTDHPSMEDRPLVQEIQPAMPVAPDPTVAEKEEKVRVRIQARPLMGAEAEISVPSDARAEIVRRLPAGTSLDESTLVGAVEESPVRHDKMPQTVARVPRIEPFSLAAPTARPETPTDEVRVRVMAGAASPVVPGVDADEPTVRPAEEMPSATPVTDAVLASLPGTGAAPSSDMRLTVPMKSDVLVRDVPSVDTPAPSFVPQEASSEGSLTIRPTVGGALVPPLDAKNPEPVNIERPSIPASRLASADLLVVFDGEGAHADGGRVGVLDPEPMSIVASDISVAMSLERKKVVEEEKESGRPEQAPAIPAIDLEYDAVSDVPDDAMVFVNASAAPASVGAGSEVMWTVSAADAQMLMAAAQPLQVDDLVASAPDDLAIPGETPVVEPAHFETEEERWPVVAPSPAPIIGAAPAEVEPPSEPEPTRTPFVPTMVTEDALDARLEEASASAAGLLLAEVEPLHEDVSLGLVTPDEVSAPANALAHRTPRVRLDLLEDLGGSELTELGVELALDWLRRHQSPDGSWSGHDYDAACGACPGPSREDGRVVLTALCTLAFLGADHTHATVGTYQPTVASALAWLVARQGEDGDLSSGADIHAHAIATLAIAEALQMTGDASLRDPLARAVGFIETFHASSDDPWRARVSDEPVLAWQVMALIGARRAGMEIPDTILDAARDRLDDLVVSGTRGVYAPRPGARPTRIATAEAAFARRLLGYSPRDRSLAESARVLARDSIAWDEANTTAEWSLTTLALFQHQGPLWTMWNRALIETLLSHQETSGRAAGSWKPRDERSQINGRVHQTAMGALMLETYYRYLPGFMDDEALDRGVVRGRVLDAESAMPLGGALVRLDLAGRAPLIAVTRDDGRYTLRPGPVPEHIALIATREGYEPASVSVPTQRLVSGVVERDIVLSRETLDEVALERRPEVHHLGNNEFTGRINSQFQRRSEGLVYRATFTLTREQIDRATPIVYLRLLAKGAQAPNPVRINGHRLSRYLTDSPRDGSFGAWQAPVRREWLVEGENTLEIRSVRGESDLDDFEFVNIRLLLRAQEH